MNVTGKLMKKYPERQWQGKNGTVVSRDFSIETVEKTYPNYYLFSCHGDILDKLENFRIGDSIDVSFVINGRKGTGQYEGRIFMDLKALDVKLYLQADNSQPEMPKGHAGFEEETMPDVPDNDELPF